MSLSFLLTQQVHAEVDKVPLNALLLVFFLFENEHGVVEELLKPLIGVINEKLLQHVQFKDLEPSDVQNACGFVEEESLQYT